MHTFHFLLQAKAGKYKINFTAWGGVNILKRLTLCGVGQYAKICHSIFISPCLTQCSIFTFGILLLSFDKMENQQPKPHRRVRYSGTHPKSFNEKYKELQPGQYAEDVEKVIQQGRTPAGMHRSICMVEVLIFLQIIPGQVGLDATLGYGGHSLEMVKCLIPGGRLYAIDVDPIELPKTKIRLESLGFGSEVVTLRKLNFSQIDQIVLESGLLDFVLADLGVSSMQMDNPERGFSLKMDGPLDLRLNPKTGKPASDLLKKLTFTQLEEILKENSDEPYAAEIAKTTCSKTSKGIEVKTTSDFKKIIEEALAFLPQKDKKELVKKSCQRCFQALRIAVNDEYNVLDKFLEKLPNAIKPGGRVAILTFHSGEDRRVKKAFQAYHRLGICSKIALEPIRPTPAEINSNPRARSAKLRWAIMG